MITSSRNPKVQYVRALQAKHRARQAEGAFVVEGVRLVEEALGADWSAQLVLHTRGISARGQATVNGFQKLGADVEEVQEHVMKSASDTKTPQGILAVLINKEVELPPALNLVLIADGIRDPGNLGSILRSASAAGVQAILLPPGVVDPFSPKVIRAGMGAHFRLPIHKYSWEELYIHLRDLQVYLASPGSGTIYYQADFIPPIGLIIGSEAHGPSSEARGLATSEVHIPMTGEVESLNAAAAASVLLFEVKRQRAMHINPSKD
jgi:TrmH family RNA methyltransferase